ncbi:hypothetical protein [Coxiella burnetii]|uniref:hypothetical protein n=1 Tax=Coxiella burnetii TaxID=777 RepID=UPI00016313BD|nr:hypothetical protein [Coxiella burnetii]EAX32717.2 hypothetical protein A35_09020 [Coxiella burnetii 'MSU Goat Q177']
MNNQIDLLDLLELALIRRNDRLIREYFEGIPHYLNIDDEYILWSRVQRILHSKHNDAIEICINLYLTVDNEYLLNNRKQNLLQYAYNAPSLLPKELAFDFLKEALSPMQIDTATIDLLHYFIPDYLDSFKNQKRQIEVELILKSKAARSIEKIPQGDLFALAKTKVGENLIKECGSAYAMKILSTLTANEVPQHQGKTSRPELSITKASSQTLYKPTVLKRKNENSVEDAVKKPRISLC